MDVVFSFSFLLVAPFWLLIPEKLVKRQEWGANTVGFIT